MSSLPLRCFLTFNHCEYFPWFAIDKYTWCWVIFYPKWIRLIEKWWKLIYGSRFGENSGFGAGSSLGLEKLYFFIKRIISPNRWRRDGDTRTHYIRIWDSISHPYRGLNRLTYKYTRSKDKEAETRPCPAQFLCLFEMMKQRIVYLHYFSIQLGTK